MTIVNISENQKVCPFMSGQPLNIKVAGVVDHPGAQAVSAMMVPCAKEKCALWSKDLCSLCPERLTAALGNVAVGLTDVAGALEPFDAPLSGSPTTHLVEAIESLIETLRDRKPSPKTPR